MGKSHPRAIVVSYLAGSALVVCAAVFMHSRVDAQAPGEKVGQLGDGRVLFNTYCASCHGPTGAGNGPAAPAMRRTPPDITGLALANGGLFPSERIGRIIDGRDVEAHGDREMPVWGDAFEALPGGHSQEVVGARIAAVVRYLESIQRRRG